MFTFHICQPYNVLAKLSVTWYKRVDWTFFYFSSLLPFCSSVFHRLLCYPATVVLHIYIDNQPTEAVMGHQNFSSRGRDRGSGSPPPWKIIRNIGFLSNTGQDPLKNNKATKLLMLGHHWHASETPFMTFLCSASLFKTSLCSKQCGPRLNCSPKSSLIQVHNVCLYGEISHWRKHKLHFPYITTNITVVIPLRQFGSRHPLRCYSKITFK